MSSKEKAVKVSSKIEPKETHIDDWVDRFDTGSQTENEKYARWFFFLHRLAAVYKADWAKQIKQYKLFCTYNGKRYRVTGASRMGDVWLAEDMNREAGYDHRVMVDVCSNWSPIPFHAYVLHDTAEWSETYRCIHCDTTHTYSAEDRMSAKLLTEIDKTECKSEVMTDDPLSHS